MFAIFSLTKASKILTYPYAYVKILALVREKFNVFIWIRYRKKASFPPVKITMDINSSATGWA